MKDSKKLFKQRIKQLLQEGKHIGVSVNTDPQIRKPLVESGLTESEILNDLRYFIEKGYLKPYSKNSDKIEDITLTAKGQDWLEEKIEHVKLEKVKWYYTPWLVLIFGTIIAFLILYCIFGIK